ncbi:NAD(P)/FAD-dependent oxidoreductase [soil metagenome]
MEESYDAVIIGGGHNGLVAAWYLAQGGLRVGVFERRDFVGGGVVTEELWPGYRVPTCSYICYLLQDKVIEDMALREHGFDVHELMPYSFTPFPDGGALVSWRDKDQTTAQLAKILPADAANYSAYTEKRERMAAILKRWFLKPPPTLAELVDDARAHGDEDELEELLFGSVSRLLDDHFESPKVKGWLAGAWDAGDPDAPCSLLSSIYPTVSAFTADENAGIVVGGMGGITQAMARACQAAGVDIHTGSEVASILIENGQAAGIELVDGSRVTARTVISNADPKRTFLGLTPAGALPDGFRTGIERLTTKAAYFKFHAVMNGLPDFSRHLGPDYDPRTLAQIKICPSLDYYRKAWDDASHGRITDSPVMSIQIPSVYDRTLIDRNDSGHVMSIWVQYAPVTPAHGTWDDLREQAGEMLIDTIAQYAPNIREVIRDWVLFTPADIEERVGMTDGNIRHIDMVAGQMFTGRLDYRTPVEGLYLCGAGTHPGGEVTGAPGHNAAQVVLSEMGAVVQG